MQKSDLRMTPGNLQRRVQIIISREEENAGAFANHLIHHLRGVFRRDILGAQDGQPAGKISLHRQTAVISGLVVSPIAL